MVKNLPAMQESWVRSLSWEDLLKKGRATHFNIPARRISWTEESDQCSLQGHKESEMTESHTHTHTHTHKTFTSGCLRILLYASDYSLGMFLCIQSNILCVCICKMRITTVPMMLLQGNNSTRM